MCGIVGYIGEKEASQIILNGLKRLEYRGYDSAGLAVLDNQKIEIRREVGKLNKLVSLVESAPISGKIGLAIHDGQPMGNLQPEMHIHT
jgi:glucosamine--fructose-6-phosphate aminotransferase (isomerizing)